VEENSVRKFRKVTLSSNGLDAVVPIDNIAIAVRVEGEDENHKRIIFTRVFLKQAVMPDGNYVDVREKPEDII
jgi:hypothetical protein